MTPDSDADSSDPDSTDLAIRFLRLWEEAWAQVAQDPDIARYWANLFASLQRSVPPSGIATATAPRYSYEHGQPGWQTDRPAPAAPPPVDGGDRTAELLRRISELERSVAELTAAVYGPGERQSRR